MKKRLEFTNPQKAEIYARDKAVCAFSWKILWILHYWTSYLWDTDWVDHIKPAMRWWDNSIENWICASSFYNWKKKDNSSDNKFLFVNWKPTNYYYSAYGFLPTELIDHLKRFDNIHFSDWYLNRAYQNFMLCLEVEYNPLDIKWNAVKRGLDYWAWATFKKMLEWKKIALKEQIEDFRTRLYNKSYQFSEDQLLMLEIINCNTSDEIKALVYKLLPYYKNSIRYFNELLELNNKSNIKEFETKIKQEKYLSKRDKEVLLDALKQF